MKIAAVAVAAAVDVDDDDVVVDFFVVLHQNPLKHPGQKNID